MSAIPVDLQQRIAENIALLYSLGEVAAPPTSYKPNGVRPAAWADYTLTLEEEKDLVSALAFLSNVHDDPLKVTAVAAQEQEEGLFILVAANTAANDDTRPFLGTVTNSFEQLAGLLSKAAVGKCRHQDGALCRATIANKPVQLMQEISRTTFSNASSRCAGGRSWPGHGCHFPPTRHRISDF